MNEPQLLNKSQVISIVRVCDRSIERLVKAGRFPRPVRLGKCAYWEEQVVESWMAAKMEAQRAWKPKQRRGHAAVSTAASNP